MAVDFALSLLDPRRHIGGFLRALLLRLTGREVLRTGGCRRCGGCCREVNIEYHGRWIRSEAQFARLLRGKAEYRRFRLVGRDEHGYCLFTCDLLTAEGACGDHDNRLDLCREYPSKELYFLGAETLRDCGYTLRVGVPFRRVLRRAARSKRARPEPR